MDECGWRQDPASRPPADLAGDQILPAIRSCRRSATALARQGVVAAAKLDQSIVDLDPLALEMRDLLLDGFRAHGEARALLVAMGGDHVADLDQREPQPLALEDELQMLAILGAVEARQPLPRRAEQAFILVEPQGAQRD